MYYKKIIIPPELQSKFDLFMENEKINVAKINAYLAIFLVSTSVIIDYWALSKNLYEAFIVRLIAVSATLVVLSIIIIAPKIFALYYKTIVAINYFVLCLCLDYIIYLAQPTDIAFYMYIGGLNIVLLMMYSWATLGQALLFLISAITILGYIVAMTYHKEAAFHNISDIIISNLFMIFASMSAGLLTRQIRDSIQYQNFLLQNSLTKSLNESQRKTDKLSYFLEHDHLTQLKNRRYAEQFINSFIYNDKMSHEDNSLTLLFMDLNGFKAVNDKYGHDVGDEVLKIVAKRLMFCMREGDSVVRLGGDEFVILLPYNIQDNKLKSLFEKIQNSILSPMKVKGTNIDLTLSISIGSSTYPEDADNYNELIKIADAKMYKEKHPINIRKVSTSNINSTKLEQQG